jgi:hypothetical protein
MLLATIMLAGAAGPSDAWHSPHLNAISTVANPGVSGQVVTPKPCPTYLPAMAPKTYLVVNNSNIPLQCRLRHPDVGGWSPYVTVPPGGRLLDKKLEADQLVVHCAPPMRQRQVRVLPRERYSMIRPAGSSEGRIVRVAMP